MRGQVAHLPAPRYSSCTKQGSSCRPWDLPWACPGCRAVVAHYSWAASREKIMPLLFPLCPEHVVGGSGINWAVCCCCHQSGLRLRVIVLLLINTRQLLATGEHSDGDKRRACLLAPAEPGKAALSLPCTRAACNDASKPR